MTHHVQAGNARPKLRHAGGVFALGLVTGGFYTAWWWHRTVRDFVAFDETSGARSPLRPALETALAFGAVAAIWLSFVLGFEATTYADGFTTFHLHPLANLIGSAAALTLLIRILCARSHVQRFMLQSGMLPEDAPRGAGFYVPAILLGICGASAMVQSAMNRLWIRYPRYYGSIGGTREAVVSMAGQEAGRTPLPTGLHVHAPAAPAAPAQQPAANSWEHIMQALAPRAASGELSATDAATYAQAVEQVHGAAAAAAWWAYVADVDSSNVHAAFRHGTSLLARGDELGIDHLRRAMADPALVQHACQHIAMYLNQRGRAADAQQYLAYAAQVAMPPAPVAFASPATAPPQAAERPALAGTY